MLRLTDSNFSMYIELLKFSTRQDFHNDFVWLSTVHYEQEFFAIKRTLPSYRPYTKTTKKRRFNRETQLQKYA